MSADRSKSGPARKYARRDVLKTAVAAAAVGLPGAHGGLVAGVFGLVLAGPPAKWRAGASRLPLSFLRRSEHR